MWVGTVRKEVEVDLQLLNLKGLEAETVKRCIAGYTPPKTLMDWMAHLGYRIWNAVKAVFGYSDWQQACRIIEKQERKFESLMPPKFRKKHSSDRIHRQAEEMLSLLIQLNQGKLKEHHPINQLFQSMGLAYNT